MLFDKENAPAPSSLNEYRLILPGDFLIIFAGERKFLYICRGINLINLSGPCAGQITMIMMKRLLLFFLAISAMMSVHADVVTAD